MPVKSRYQTVELATNGASYQSRSIPLSSQRSYNMYPEVTPQGMSSTVMQSWPGLALKDPSFSTDPIIGCYVWDGDFYAISGVTLRKYDVGFTTFTEIGDITVAGFTRASISDNGEVMMIVAGASAYQYDGTTLSVIPSVTSNPTKVQFLNERFYINGNDGGVTVSDVLSTNFDNANVFYGRSTPEPTVTFHIFNQIIYLIDSNSIEPWQDAAVGAPPVSRINQGIIEGVGTRSINGIVNSDTYMYFVGSDGNAYRVNGFNSTKITNPVIAEKFRSMDVDAVDAEYVVMNGHNFVIFTFVNDLETWVYSESSESWFEIGIEGQQYQGVSFVFFRNEWVCGSRDNGTIFELVTDFFLNGTNPFIKERTITTISGDDIKEPGVMLEMSKIRFSLEAGTAANLNSGRSPQVMIIPSFDGGYTFGTPIVLDLGEAGDFTLPVELHMMQQFRRAIFKIRITDFIARFTIFSASIDIRKAGY